MKNNYAGFSIGFLCGMVLTVMCWRTLEKTYLNEVTGVAKVSDQLAKPEAPADLPAPVPVVLAQSDRQGTAQGPVQAPITLLEFSDFYCPFSSRVDPTLDQLMQSYPGRIRRQWKHFPLPFHEGADKIHEASECAAEQNKFWEFQDAVFSDQAKTKEAGALEAMADRLGLNKSQFMSCVESRKYQDKVKQDIAEGQKLGVNGTPAVILNGYQVSGAVPYEQFKQVVEHYLNPDKVPLPPKPEPPKRPEPPKGPVKFDDLEGHQSLGPKDALITLVEFSDFHCSFCSRLGPTLQKIMEENKGKVRRVWRQFPLPMHQGADKTAEASECAGDQGKFWEFHDKVFSSQDKLKEPNSLENFAKDIGLDVKQFNDCMASGKHKQRVQDDIKKGTESGVNGTPATFINGYPIIGAVPYEAFKPWVDHFLNPEKHPLPSQAGPPPRIEPQKQVEFKDLKGKPALGSKDAPITIVEISDFHCPFCKRGSETVNKLMKEYEGKIRRVWRHFPLSMHAGAEKTHQASECAGDQDKFWEYHTKLFENQNKLSEKDSLTQFAKDLGLNMSKFEKCISGGKHVKEIQEDIKAMQKIGIGGTPAYYINGELLSGAQPYENFKQVVDRKLSEKKK